MAEPTQTNISNTTIPDYAKPYVETLLGKAEALTSQNPYALYPGQRTAGFTNLQNDAFADVRQLQPAGQLQSASKLASDAGIRALQTNYQGGQFGVNDVNAPSLQNYQMGPAQQVRTQQFTGNQVGQYMNPYLQNALAPQLEEMRRQYGITGTQQRGAATQSGAFGGAREAIMAAENARNMNTAMNQAIGTGYSNAYTNAQQQFNAQQAANLQAQQANQQAGLTTGQANLNALLGVQNLGAGQNLQAQLANQSAGLQAQQLGEQSRQFGAGLGLQGLQTGLQASGALGNLGATQFQQQTGIIGLENQLGGQQQQQQQNVLNQQYQDFLNQKQYPYQQLSYMSDMLRGLPLSQTATSMYANPSTLSQVAGLGTAAAGAYGMYKGLAGAKEGGSTKDIKKRPAGLAELALSKMA